MVPYLRRPIRITLHTTSWVRPQRTTQSPTSSSQLSAMWVGRGRGVAQRAKLRKAKACSCRTSTTEGPGHVGAIVPLARSMGRYWVHERSCGRGCMPHTCWKGGAAQETLSLPESTCYVQPAPPLFSSCLSRAARKKRPGRGIEATEAELGSSPPARYSFVASPACSAC